jgi:hypothetical protein
MKLFSSLPNLASIEVLKHMYTRVTSLTYVQFYPEAPWKIDLLNDLGTQHPHLRFVYITASNKDFNPSVMFIVWQRNSYRGWTGREVKDYDTILNAWNELD